MAEVGIDLGTTNSAIAQLRNKPEIIENQGRATTPSVVAYEDGEILVGGPAKDQSVSLPSIVSVKRKMGTDERLPLGDTDYSPEDISAMILKELKKVAEERLGEPVDGAVVTIPAYFSGAQKEATKRAGELAGIKNVRLLAEPIAAALAYGAEDLILVYDLGGGTFDVAIIDCFDYKMLGLAGDNYLGGDDFDRRLIDHLAKEVKSRFAVDIESNSEANQLAKLECEKAKITLSSREQTKIRFQTVVNDKVVNLMLPVTREEFEGMIGDLVDRTLELVDEAIEKAKEKDESFSKNDIQSVLLVGGSTYVPLVRQKVAAHFGRDPSTKINPDLAVALGAAIHTASGPVQKGAHWVRLDPLPLETASTQCHITGRTSPGSRIQVQGAAAPAGAQADDRGKFAVDVELVPNATSEVTIIAADAGGEERKAGFAIRHDSNFSGEEVRGRRKTPGGGGVLPRTLGIGVTGDDNRLGIILPSQTDIPCSVQSRDYCITSRATNMPGVAEIPVFEGDLVYAPLNTHLATLRLETAASPSPAEPLEITFQVTEDHLLTVTARMVNFPDRVVTTKIKCESANGTRLHVIERGDRVLHVLGDKLRPEVKAKLGKLKQGILDLCDQYRRDPQPDRFERVKSMGAELRTELERLEATHGV